MRIWSIFYEHSVERTVGCFSKFLSWENESQEYLVYLQLTLNYEIAKVLKILIQTILICIKRFFMVVHYDVIIY